MPNSDNLFTFKNERFEADYIKFGSGKNTLIILPGLSLKPVTLSAPAIVQAYSVFEKNYTVFLFEKRKKVPAGFSIGDIADDTAEMMRQLGLENAFVFGVSQGGMTAQLLASKYPELVRGLVLASSLSKSDPVFLRLMNEWQAFAAAGDRVSLNRSFFKNVYSKEYFEKYRDVFASLENEGTDEELARFLCMVQACREFDSTQDIKNIKCPALVMGAEGDIAVTADSQRKLAALLGTEPIIYNGYAHAVYDEAPDFKQKILAFTDALCIKNPL